MKRLLCWLLGHKWSPWYRASQTISFACSVYDSGGNGLSIMTPNVSKRRATAKLRADKKTIKVRPQSGGGRISASIAPEDIKGEQRDCGRCGKREFNAEEVKR